MEIPKNYTGKINWANGCTQYFLSGQTHRLDGPAIIWSDGQEFYYINGECCTDKQYKQWILLNDFKLIKNIV